MTGPQRSDSDHFVVIPLPLLDAPNMALKVYAVLRSYADWNTGQAWPSRATIAGRAGISLDTLDRAVKWLVEHGWVTVTGRTSEHGDRTSNLYTVYGVPRDAATLSDSAATPSDSAATVAAKPVEELEPVEREPENEHPPAPPSSPDLLQFSLMQDERRVTKESPNVGIEDQFDRFWSEYPKKVAKAAALKAFKAAIKKASLDAILTALARQKRVTWRNTERQYIPNASTWLNQERWADEVEASSGRRGGDDWLTYARFDD